VWADAAVQVAIYGHKPVASVAAPDMTSILLPDMPEWSMTLN
jgi:hypothetical protein